VLRVVTLATSQGPVEDLGRFCSTLKKSQHTESAQIDRHYALVSAKTLDNLSK
jgi:hypothetical protein